MLIDDMLCEAKKCIIEYHTGSGLVTAKPCYLYNLVVAPTGFTDAAIMTLINGENANGEILINIRTLYTNSEFTYPIPIYFSRGLYLDFDSNVSGVTIQYRIE